MQELLDQLVRYARGIWRYRWMVMGVAWLVCLIGWAAIMRMPDVYQASARVHIDTQSILRPLLRGLTVESGAMDRISIITRTLLSTPNMEELARMTDLDLRADDQAQMDALISRLRSNISLQGARNENLYTITYQDNDRNVAKRVVQSLLTIFVESLLGQSRVETDTAHRFIEEQIQRYEARLREAEDRLAEFKRENLGLMPGEGKDYYRRLEAAMSELENARLQLRELRNRRASQKRQVEEYKSQQGGVALYGENVSPEQAAIDSRIQSMQQQLDELLLRYTKQHPDVLEIQDRIQQLKEERDQIETESSAGAQDSNPIYQQLKIMLGETDSQIAAMQARVSEYEARVEKLREMVNTIPHVEAELARLNRDYQVNKRNYEELLERREAIKMSEKVDISADDVKFRVVDPPRVPLEPSGPPRIVLMSLVLAAGFGVGGGLGLLMYLIRPAFEDPRLLKECTGYPVFGSVHMVYTDDYLKKRRLALLALSLATLGLLGVYGAVVSAELLDLKLLRT